MYYRTEQSHSHHGTCEDITEPSQCGIRLPRCGAFFLCDTPETFLLAFVKLLGFSDAKKYIEKRSEVRAIGGDNCTWTKLLTAESAF
jgi:hypothetical protein